MQDLSRRTFLKSSALGVAAPLSMLAAEGSAAKAADRPNILLIMTDQQHADAMSCAGNTYLKTPALDALAAKGTRFTKAYVTQPLCMPSRSSMQTGHFPHEVGVPMNSGKIPKKYPMLGRTVAAMGYECAYFGKWHVGISTKEIERHGYTTLKATKDSALPETAKTYLSENHKNPFFLTLSFINPHNVCQLARKQKLPDGPIAPLPSPDKFPPLPANFDIPEKEPTIIREIQEKYRPLHYPTKDWTADDWRAYLWGYYRIVEKVDAEIGEVLHSLETSAYAKNTVVMFVSDHGEGVAMHHWNQKQILYDQAVRVPMIIRVPGAQQSAVCDKLISTGLDIFPTILEMVQAKPIDLLPGKSLCPLLSDEKYGDWKRTHVIAETRFAQGGNWSGVSGRMVRSERYKYVIYNKGTGREQLFDMETDAGETKNLITIPKMQKILDQHRAWMSKWGKETSDDFPFMTEASHVK